MRLTIAGVLAFAPALVAGNHGHRSSAQWLPRNSPEGAVRLSETLVEEGSLPHHFDWRNINGKNYVTSDWNQHIPQYCGACWIHGTLSAYNDRIKVRRGARFPDIRLGRQGIVNCVPPADGKGAPPGCNGGDATMIHHYLSQQNMPDETCLPYEARNMGCEPINVCRNCKPGTAGCYAVKNYIGYGVSSYGNVKGEKAMMKEIYARGPIVCSFATDDPFMYKFADNIVQHHGVYISPDKKNASQIDHDMEIAGWGETASGDKYWVIRNSWGTYWGQGGWFKLRRGVDELMSESDCAWAEPTFDELDSELDGKILGDYVQGIGPTSKAEEAARTSADSVAAKLADDSSNSSMEAGTTTIAGAFFTGAAAVMLVVLLTGRARVRNQPLLG